MMGLSSFLPLAHLLGFALAVGAATSKTTLLLRTRRDPQLVQTFLEASKPLTRLIIAGLLVLAATGAGWVLFYSYPMTPRLWLKVGLVAALFAVGPLIDFKLEPALRRAAPARGGRPSNGFLAARDRYLVVEVAATLLFFVITVLWVTR